MACSGAYASAWQYAAFWCGGAIRYGLDNGGGVGVASLTDSSANFTDLGVEANVGMVLYNLTTGLSGLITAVTATTITATGVVWTNGNSYRVVAISANEISQINLYLEITAADLHAALAASGACSCNLASWATTLLQKLNIIEAGVFHVCPCGSPNLTSDQRATYLAWINEQLSQIRDGRLELCEDETGSEFPALDWAESADTDFAAVNIIVNDALRNS